MKKTIYEIWGEHSGHIIEFTTLSKAKKHLIMLKEFDEAEHIHNKYSIIKRVETDYTIDKTIYAE